MTNVKPILHGDFETSSRLSERGSAVLIAGKGTVGGAGRPQPMAVTETGLAGGTAAQAMTVTPHPQAK